VLAEEAPAVRDLVDQLEPASVLVVPAGLSPQRQAGPAVIDDVYVHDRAAPSHGDGHAGGSGGVLDRVGDELAGEQLGIERGWMAGQDVPDELPGDRDLLGPPGEGAGSGRGRHTCRAHPFPSACDSEGRTGHLASTIPRDYCPYI